MFLMWSMELAEHKDNDKGIVGRVCFSKLVSLLLSVIVSCIEVLEHVGAVPTKYDTNFDIWGA